MVVTILIVAGVECDQRQRQADALPEQFKTNQCGHPQVL
jgi:hypothetical protein